MYSSPITLRLMKSRRMRWSGKQGVWGRGKAYRVLWWRNLTERDNLGDPGVGGRIILRWIFRK